MSQNFVTFTKVFYKENIISIIEKNPNFIKISSNNKKLKEFYFETDPESFLSSYKGYTFDSTNIYVYDNFAFVNCRFLFDSEDIEQFSKTIFRICHEKVHFPADELIQELFSSLDKNENLLYIRPSGSEIIKEELSSFDDYSLYCQSKSLDTETYSFIYYTYELSDELSETEELCLKNATEGNSKDAPHKAIISLKEVDKYFSIFASNIGCGLIKNSFAKVNDNYTSEFYFKYLEVLKEIVYFEHKAKEFNSFLDNNNYKNLDDINIKVRRDMRKAVHLKYDIKNSLKKNKREDRFFGAFLDSIDFEGALDEFIEICHSIEKELRAEIDKREEEHDKHFDRILSVVAVFAIVSVFKDGSDLLLSMIDTIKNKSFDFSGLISLMAPILCAVSIFIILKLFRRK